MTKKTTLVLFAAAASLILAGCGESGAPPNAAPAGATTEKAAPQKAGASKMKGLSPDSLTVPPGSTSNVGAKLNGK